MKDGEEVGSGTFDGTPNGEEVTFTIEAPEGVTFDQVIFRSNCDEDGEGDYALTSIEYESTTTEVSHEYQVTIEANLADTDGSETLSDVTLSGVPEDAVFTVDGEAVGTDNEDGTWSFTSDELGEMTMTVADGEENFDLTASVTASEAEGGTPVTATTDAVSVVVPGIQNVIEGTEEVGGDTHTIDVDNVTSTDQGFAVTAQNIVDGELTEASADNIATWGGTRFGASGDVSDTDSGVSQQIGYDMDSDQSERLIIDFDNEVSSADFSFDKLYTDSYAESGHWQTFSNGELVAEGDFEADSGVSGTVTIDTGANFDQIVFTAHEQSDGTDGSDFFITEVNFTTASDGGDDVIEGTALNDEIHGLSGDDVINAGEGDDVVFGGDGSDTLTFLAHQGNDVVDGGEGGSWTDTLHLDGFEGHSSEDGWTLTLDDGSTVTSTDDLNGEMVLSGDASGTITFDEGGSVDFENIEKIVW